MARGCGITGIALSTTGWGLEWIRQRGTCELGDKSPDTLVASVSLILLGGGVLGLLGVLACLVGFRSRMIRGNWTTLIVSATSLLSAIPLFFFANSGPGSWFQYCGT